MCKSKNIQVVANNKNMVLFGFWQALLAVQPMPCPHIVNILLSETEDKIASQKQATYAIFWRKLFKYIC